MCPLCNVIATGGPAILLETPVGSLSQPSGNNAAVLERTMSLPVAGDNPSEIVAVSALQPETNPSNDGTGTFLSLSPLPFST